MIRFTLALLLTACAQSTMRPDTGAFDDAQIQGDVGPSIVDGRTICDTAIARNDELQCQLSGPNVSQCIPQWDGREQCDQARAAECLERLEQAPDCYGLRIVWRGDCLTACSPTAP